MYPDLFGFVGQDLLRHLLTEDEIGNKLPFQEWETSLAYNN